MNNDEALESALTDRSQTPQEDLSSLPPVNSALRRLDSLSHNALETAHSSDILRPSQLPSRRPIIASFGLVVLLSYRSERLRDTRFSLGPWDRWTQENEAEQELAIIERNIKALWDDSFLSSYRSSKDVEEVLWTPFPVEVGGKTIRGKEIKVALELRIR
ncbi:hypothetical protein PQX77_013312 [Marasmius sp. AFHP31]|nr:hypothetical protein PQX77_013312 [Marasmius sp. AFHP31]